MSTPTLVLQYPDWAAGKIRLLATTSDKKALAAFKAAVLEEARLRSIGADDPILRIEYGQELQKLERLLEAVIPDDDTEEASDDR